MSNADEVAQKEVAMKTENLREMLFSLKKLSDPERKAILQELMVECLGEIHEERVLVDNEGNTIGYFLPPDVRMRLAGGAEAQEQAYREALSSPSNLVSSAELHERLRAAK